MNNQTDYRGNYMRLKQMWQQSRPIQTGDAVQKYLEGRGLTASPVQRVSLSLRDGREALLSPISNSQGKFISIHVVYVTQYGKKDTQEPVKQIMPPAQPLSGGAIRLFAPTDTLAICEGVETALAVNAQTGWPAWSTCSAQMMEKVIIPEGIEFLYIIGDNDLTFTGQAAAYNLAKRLYVQEKRSVGVITPTTPGTDWNDVWIEEKKWNKVAKKA